MVLWGRYVHAIHKSKKKWMMTESGIRKRRRKDQADPTKITIAILILLYTIKCFYETKILHNF